MKTTAEAAKGQWARIYQHYKLPGITGKRHFKGECPLCGEKGKFRCDDKNGNGEWICKCGSGNGLTLLMRTQEKTYAQIAAEVDQIVGRQFERSEYQPRPETGVASVREKVSNCFSKLQYLRGTAAEQYLQARHINTLPTESVRFNPEQKDRSGRTFGAMWAIATDDKGNACYLHRTLLDGNHKADVESAKKMLSLQDDNYLQNAGSVAIRMFPVDETLGIAEGIETALASREIYKFNVWAVLNTSLMKRFRVPNGVKRLIIFADTDKNAAGHAAAFACAHSNLQDSKNDLREVIIRWPDQGDFNDVLINHHAVREIQFFKKVAA